MSEQTEETQQTVIRVRPETRKLIDDIRRDKGWTITEAVSRAVDALKQQSAPPDGAAAKHRGNRKRATSAA